MKKKDLGRDEIKWDVYHNTKDNVEVLPWVRPDSPNGPSNTRNVAPSPPSPNPWPKSLSQQRDIADNKSIDAPVYEHTADNVDIFPWNRMASPTDKRNTAPMSHAQKKGIANEEIRMDVYHNAQPLMDIANWSRPDKAPPAEISYPVKRPDNWKPMSADSFFRTLVQDPQDDEEAFVFYDNDNHLWRF